MRLAQPRIARRSSTRGIALITTLLLLSIFSVMTIAMVIALNSDVLINGYYRNFRGSFYAADSGLNIARQYLVNQLTAAVPANFSASSGSPVPAGTEATVLSGLTTLYGSINANTRINQGQGTSSWPEAFKISAASLQLVTSPAQPQVSKDSKGNITGYSYTYNYSLTAVGQTRSNEQTTLDDQGSVILNLQTVPAGGVTTSFAAWGTFINNYPICSAPFVPGTLTGPFFTNDAWTFGSTGAYIFTDPVGSASANAGYYFSNGQCDQIAGASDKKGNTTIKPTFQAGFNLGQNPLPLPANDFNQKEAVVDGLGDGSAFSLTTLKNAAGTNYSAGATSGVYMPFTTTTSSTCSTAPCVSGGGIYVEGNAGVTLAAATNSSTGAPQQVFTIVQGSTTTTVTLDFGTSSISPTTTFKTVTGGTTSTQTLNGLPMNATTSPPSEAAMLYVDGNITSLAGASGQPAIQDGSAVTVTAANNVTITGDIKYKTEPVTLTQNQVPGTPADTPIPGNDKGQVLGIYTATGDIQLKVPTNNQNLEVDASLAMISQSGSGGLIDTWNQINTLTIVGGRIANQAKQGNITTRNIYFDRRFTQGGFAPPWFPSTTITPPATSSATVTSSVQRVRWLDQSSY
ncbi:MAG: hypothetical protein LAO08_17635 [Acidobacteriia bacterium]|nr:hypothetical protein [Terriglobia bacterium]